MKMLPIRNDLYDKELQEYIGKLSKMDLVQLVKEFFSYLDYVEESDSGRVFHPITIGSCRVMAGVPLQACLDHLREKVGAERNEV